MRCVDFFLIEVSAIEYSTNLNITYNINDTINKINKIINFGVDFQVFFFKPRFENA